MTSKIADAIIEGRTEAESAGQTSDEGAAAATDAAATAAPAPTPVQPAV
jgi:hypothetical protein